MLKHHWDDRKVVRAVTEYQKVYHVSVVRAVRRSLMWARTRVVRELTSSIGLNKQATIRRRIRVTVKNGTVVRGVLSIQVNSLSAIKLKGVFDTGVQTGMVRTGHGVRIPGKTVGRFYRDAFIAPGLGGHWQVFRRKGKSRLPIEAIKIPIHDAARASIMKWVNESVGIAQTEIVRQLALRKVSSSAVDAVSVSDAA